MNQTAKGFLLVGWLMLAVTVPVYAGGWWTVETEHFAIHFPDGYETEAYRTAAIAEEIYPVATKVIGHVPDEKTQIVLKDVTDTANGFSVRVSL